jgi:hypothetical protein
MNVVDRWVAEASGTTGVISATRSLATIARRVADTRPLPDTRLDQYLLTPECVEMQAAELIRRYADAPLLIVGDDDHVSLPVAACSDAKLMVVEIDPRVVASLRAWSDRLALENLSVIAADIRAWRLGNPSTRWEAFYMNPPYDRVGRGGAIITWLKALLGCGSAFRLGTIVLPAPGQGEWIDELWVALRDYFRSVDLQVIGVDRWRHRYENTTDPGLESCNVHIRCDRYVGYV